MSRQTIRAIFLLGVAVSVVGCASSAVNTTSTIKARSYVMDKERVDQNMEGGNFGYIMGTPKPEDRSTYKKTRKVYVLEVSKEEGLPEDESVIPPPLPKPTLPPRAAESTPTEPVASQPASSQIVIPNFDEETAVAPAEREPYSAAVESAPAEGSYTEYTIQKNDTLQKISKKHYDTYRKWMQIYEANKDVIPDPNVIKPGITIRIPNL